MRTARRPKTSALALAAGWALLGAAWADLSDVPDERLQQAASADGTEAAPSQHEEWFLVELIPPELLLAGADPLEDSPSELAALGTSEGPVAVGLARWCRSEGEDGRLQLEWEFQFPEAGSRVLHVERHFGGSQRLVWRELRAVGGRTVMAEWAEPGGGVRLREWGGPKGLREELEREPGTTLPLALLARARAGDLPSEPVPLFDPLSRSIESVSARERHAEEGRRRVELVRADGTLAAAWLLEGRDLLGFQWQAGGLRARRIPPEEYERRRAARVAAGAR